MINWEHVYSIFNFIFYSKISHEFTNMYTVEFVKLFLLFFFADYVKFLNKIVILSKVW